MKKEKIFNFLLSQIDERNISGYIHNGNVQILSISKESQNMGNQTRYLRYEDAEDMSKFLRKENIFLRMFGKNKYRSKYKAYGFDFDIMCGRAICLQENIDNHIYWKLDEENYPKRVIELINASQRNMKKFEEILRQRSWQTQPQRYFSTFELSVLRHARMMFAKDKFLQEIIGYIVTNAMDDYPIRKNMMQIENPVKYYLQQTYLEKSDVNIVENYIDELINYFAQIYMENFQYLKCITKKLGSDVHYTILNDTEWHSSNIKEALEQIAEFLDFS